jgi:hypothetical protein
MRKRDKKSIDEYRDVAKFLVYFRIDKVLPLVGADRQCF